MTDSHTPSPRFFVEAPIRVGDEILLPEKPAHHLANVLRLNVGESATLFNGQGGEYRCVISSTKKKDVRLSVETFDEINRNATLPIHLGMAVIKRDAMDAVLAKAVEMGVSEITPVVTDRCTVAKKVIQNRQSHWDQVLITACEQCGLNLVPHLNPATPFADWIDSSSGGTQIIASPIDGESSVSFDQTQTVDLLVGPEGGFTQEELDVAKQQGFQAMTLGERVLRAETAPTALIAVIQHQWNLINR